MVGKITLLISVLLLGLVSGFAVLSWQPDRTVAELAPRWAPAPSQFIEVMGMQVHVRDQGPQDDPEPIVLIHGTSASLHTWEGWVQELKASHRIITFDLPGFGLTGPFSDGNYRADHFVKFVTALLQKMGVEHYVLGGNSFGGYLAWHMALAQPDQVSRLILVDAAGYPEPDESPPIAFLLAQIPQLKPLLEKMLPRKIVEISVRKVYGNPARVTPELVDRYFELTLRAGNRAAVVDRFQQVKFSEANQAQIAQLKQPTLIIWGDQDQLIPPASAARFHKDIKGSELVIFKGLGHVPHEEDPAATVARVKAFL